MKKIIYILLVGVVALSFLACSSASVDVTFPASFFDGMDMTSFDTETYAKENGFEKATVNEEGNVVVTMSKSKQDEILKEMKEQIKTTFDEIIASQDLTYVEAIEHNDDYTQVTIDVIRSEYEGAFDFTPMQVYFSVAFYQLMSGVESHCDITIRDSQTEETIKNFVYPDVMQ